MPPTRWNTSRICDRCGSTAISLSTMSTAISTIAALRADGASRRRFSTPKPLRAAVELCAHRFGDDVGAVLRSDGRWRPSCPRAGVAVVADGSRQPYIASVVYASALYGFLAIVLSGMWLPVWSTTAVRRTRPRCRCGWGHRCCSTCILRLVSLTRALRLLSRCLSPCGCTCDVSGRSLASSRLVRLLADGNGSRTGRVHCRRTGDRLLISDVVGCAAGAFRWSGVAARAVAGTAALAFCFLPQVLTYIALYGRAAPSPTVQGKMTWTSPHAWHVLASPANGLLFWTPLALPRSSD